MLAIRVRVRVRVFRFLVFDTNKNKLPPTPDQNKSNLLKSIQAEKHITKTPLSNNNNEKAVGVRVFLFAGGVVCWLICLHNLQMAAGH